MKRNAEAVIGSRQRMNYTGVPGSFVLADTLLISARAKMPQQWLITLSPPTTDTATIPYQNGVDGQPNYFPSSVATPYQAPILPSPANNSALQVFLRWGAGGVATTTRFDYPSHGAVFGVTADNIDLIASVRNPAAQTINTVGEIPQVQAFMVPGSPASQTPLTYQEGTIAIAAGATVFYTVKPYAKQVRVTVQGGTVNARVAFFDTGFAPLGGSQQVAAAAPPGAYIESNVPGLATVFSVTNTGAAAGTLLVEWVLGFS